MGAVRMSSGRGRHTSQFSGFREGLTILSLFLLSGCMTTGSSSSASSSTVPTPTTTAATETATIIIFPSTVTLNPGASLQFSSTGGTAPYSYSVTSGGGSINPNTGLYTAPSAASDVQILVTDADNNTASTTLTVSLSDLTITASALSVIEGQNVQINGSGGTSPYAYYVVAGGGAIDPVLGLFTAPPSSGTAQIAVEDQSGEIAYLVLTIAP
jgi:hypothetical protein